MAVKFKTGDHIIVTSGDSKGVKGVILKSIPKDGSVIVQGVNMKNKKAIPSAENPQGGGKISVEFPISVSNISHIDPKTNTPTRIGFKVVDEKKVRFYKKSGEVLEA